MRGTKQSLKKLKNQVEIAENIERTEEGLAIIDINVNTEQEMYSPYSSSNYKLLNPEVVEYINSYADGTTAEKGYVFRISGENLTPESKVKIKNTMSRTFAENIANINAELKRNLFKSVWFFAMGLFFLFFVIMASIKNWGMAVYSILDITCWVFIWEAVDVFFMERAERRHLKRRYIKFALADIKFKGEN